jgi:hypothetical protein
MIRVLLLLIGAILLLPGICSLGLISSMVVSAVEYGSRPMVDVLSFLPITLAIGWGGLWLIRKALRPSPPPVAPPDQSKGQMP